MLDYRITSGMQTLYLPPVSARCLGPSRYYFRETDPVQQGGKTVCVLRDGCLLAGFEAAEFAQRSDLSGGCQRYVPPVSAAYCVKDVAFLLHMSSTGQLV